MWKDWGILPNEEVREDTMESNIIVFGFEGVSTAEDMLSMFEQMQEQGILTQEDAVVATRSGGGGVTIKQTHSVKGKYALAEPAWDCWQDSCWAVRLGGWWLARRSAPLAAR